MTQEDEAAAGTAARLARWGPRVVLLALAGGIFLAWRAGVYANFSPEGLRDWVLGTGSLGAVLFVPLFALGGLLQLPAIVFPLAAGLIWPLPIALLVAWLGSIASAAALFAVARYTVRGAVQRRLSTRFRQLDERLASNGFRTVIVFRLITFVGPGAQWLLGASRVRARDVALATPIGVIPWTVAIVALGNYEMSWLARGSILAAIVVTSIGIATLAARRASATPGD